MPKKSDFQTYYDSVSIYPRLKDKETKTLIKQVKTGDKAALDTVLKGHLRFVAFMCLNFAKGNPDLAIEYVGAGHDGLVNAIRTFDETKTPSKKFSDWMSTCVTNQLSVCYARQRRQKRGLGKVIQWPDDPLTGYATDFEDEKHTEDAEKTELRLNQEKTVELLCKAILQSGIKNPDRALTIVKMKCGLEPYGKPYSNYVAAAYYEKETGISITAERVRQIWIETINKVRIYAEQNGIKWPPE